MRVGFDVSPLTRPSSRGLRRVVLASVQELERRGVLEVVRLAPEPGRNLRLWRARELPRACAGQDLLGIHSFTSAFPCRGPGKRVQTIHELPWRHGVRENAGVRHRLWAALGPLAADRVVTATETTAADLGRRQLWGAAKLRVVPWGVGPEFAPDPPPGEIDETRLSRYRLPEEPLILCLGATRAKKRLGALLAGVAALGEHASLAGSRPHVVVTGPETRDLRRALGDAQKLGLAGRVTTLDEVEEADLAPLLRLAAVVPVLSASEGFGLPVLEALASGTPVLVTAGSAQAEVAGDAGIAVEPTDPDSVAAGLERALTRREALRYTLPERAAAFTWERTAVRLEALWRELA